MIWKIFYNVLIVPLLWCGFNLYGLVNKKAKRALRGRKDLYAKLENRISRLNSNEKRIWFHSSSMGEFEQAKPIIAEMKKRNPGIQVVVSFFSPSGYEHSLTYKLADIITYIPFDSYLNAKKFVEVVKPNVAVFVRYDIWPNHVWALKSKNIPIFIISATIQEKTYRRIPIIRSFIRSLYNTIDYVLTVSNNDKQIFDNFKLNHPIIKVVGDTRYDQVMKRSTESKMKQLIDSKILKDKKIIVVGSSWREDDEIMLPVVQKLMSEFHDLLIIWVPHEPTEENLEYLEMKMNGNLQYIRFSYLHQYKDEKIILVDSVGVLMALYQYAHIAYVGGGFGSGIHNILEPASYGIPILFGPKYTNSQETNIFIYKKAAFAIRDENELYNKLQILLKDEIERKRNGDIAASLVSEHVGATEKVISSLSEVL